MRKFLTARWQDLIMANYEVEPSLLAGRVPAGTELDLQDGKCFVSLVGFMFLDTRVLGCRYRFTSILKRSIFVFISNVKPTARSAERYVL